MKAMLIAFLLLPLTIAAQTIASPDVKPKKHRAPEGFAEGGYVGELWTLTNRMSYGYSAMSYTGNGYYFGGGFKSVTNEQHWFGYGLSVNYLKYKMDSLLFKDQHVQVMFNYLKLSPMAYVNIKVKSKTDLNFQLCALANVMTTLKANVPTYLQYGAKICVGYTAYEAHVGIGFSRYNRGPDTDIQSNWREQMLTLGVACYPGRLTEYKKYMKIKSKKQATKK